MTTSEPPTTGATRTRTAALVALLSFVAYLVTPGGLRLVPLAVMVGAAIGVVACSIMALRQRSGSRAALRTAAASAVGMVSAVLYLNSLADEPAAIPLVGVLVLLASINGLFIAALLLRRPLVGRGAGR